jgi:hypothetical protein
MVSGASFNSQTNNSSRIRISDPEKNLSQGRIPDPGGKKHHISDLDPQHYYKKFVFLRVFQKYKLTLIAKCS